MISIFSLIGSFFIFRAIEIYGPLITPDSVYYLQASENFKEGLGVKVKDAEGLKPLVHFPPLYPVFISFFDDLRVPNVLLSFITNFLLGLFMFIATNSLFSSILSVVLFSVSPNHTFNFSRLWSETLSLPLILLAIIFLWRYLNSRRMIFLLIFSLLVSISTLVRYANLFFILVIFTIPLIYRISFSHLVLSVILSSAGFIFWHVLNLMVLQGSLARDFSFHIFSFDHVLTFLKTLKLYIPRGASIHYLFGVPIYFFVVPLIVLGTVILIFFIVRENFHDLKKLLSFSDIEKVLLVCSICYVIFIFLSISFADYYIPPDLRIMSPFFVLMFSFVFIFVYRVLKFKLASLPLLFGFLIGYFSHSFSFINAARLDPVDYNNPRYANLEIISEVKKLPEGAIIYSNAPDLIYFHTRKASSSVPFKFYPATTRTNKKFDENLKRMFNRLKENDGFLVIIYSVKRPYLPTEEELTSKLNLRLYVKTKDGVIYKAGE